MALAFLNNCIFRAASSGTGSFVHASAITGYQEPDDCTNPSVVDGATYRYDARSDDNSQWEVGYGVYTASSDTLTRAVILASSNAGAATSFSAAPSVAMGGALANDAVSNPLSADLVVDPFKLTSANGNVVIQGGDIVSGDGWAVEVRGGYSPDGYGGGVIFQGGQGDGLDGGGGTFIGGSGAVNGGGFDILGGGGDAGNGGYLTLRSGSGDVDGGQITITTNDGNTGNGGDLTFNFGSGAVRGGLFFPNLPSGDPGVSGAAYVDGSGFVKISP